MLLGKVIKLAMASQSDFPGDVAVRDHALHEVPQGLERQMPRVPFVADIAMHDSDLRWLKHYGFLPLDIPSPVRGAL